MTTLRELPAIIRRAVRTGTNIHVTGEPGSGKTSVIEQTVAELQQQDQTFGYWCLYTPSLSPIDFSVPMPDTNTGTLRMYHNDRLPNAFDTPDVKGIVFLGERDNADPATNKALQKYINNEDMGGLQKPKGVIVVSDSNDINHRSGAVQQSLALLSRSRVIPVQLDVECTLKYFADTGVNPFVQAYLSLRKEHVSTFEALLKERAYRVWANPRSWERLGKSMDDADEHGETLSQEEVIGDVGEGVGREFLAFLYAATTLTSYQEIVSSPRTATKPQKLSDVYAVTAMLAMTVKAADMNAVRLYVERFPVEVQVLFLRLLTAGKSKHKMENVCTKAYTEWYCKPDMQAALGN